MLTATAANDYCGGAGSDTLNGGLGSDTAVIGDAGGHPSWSSNANGDVTSPTGPTPKP